MSWKSTKILAALAALFPFQAALASCVSKPAREIVIVVDVGHVPPHPGRSCRGAATACEFGETSARGVMEYDFNLKLAERIRDALVSGGFASTHLFVPTPGTSLAQRANYANGLNADIFISVHHDGVKDRFKTPWVYEGRQQYYFDDEKGFSLHVSPRNVAYADSLNLARILADHLMAKGLQFASIHDTSHVEGAHVPYADPTRGIYQRDSDVFVLYGAQMPAVLIEGGSIVNRDEELVVSTPEFRSLIASAVVESVGAFCTSASDTAKLASTGSANAPPAYKVTGVSANDVLNIRASPDANSAIVNTIPPDGRGVKITGDCSENWCPVDYRHALGWVNCRFLARE